MKSVWKAGTIWVLIAIFVVTALVACSADPEPTPQPTSVPEPTVVPTSTPQPTATPEPTATPQPTATPEPTATPVPEPTAVPYPAVPGILDPTNRGWPREVEVADEVISIEEPPMRVLAYSLGHDEILLALMNADRFAAVGPFTGDPAYSNVSDLAEGLTTFESGVENVLAANPDLVLVSRYTEADVVDLIKEAGVTVARTVLDGSASGNIANILLIGYMLGVEERALELVAEIQGKLDFVAERVPPLGDAERPSVIATTKYADSIYVAGSDTTEGGIVEAGGGINAAARDGVVSHQTVSIESIAAMSPDVILIAQPVEYGANEYRNELLAHPALADVPAIINNEVHVVDSRQYTTLSHWNVRGIEQTALLLYPDQFGDVDFVDFEPYDGE